MDFLIWNRDLEFLVYEDKNINIVYVNIIIN